MHVRVSNIEDFWLTNKCFFPRYADIFNSSLFGHALNIWNLTFMFKTMEGGLVFSRIEMFIEESVS